VNTVMKPQHPWPI